MAQARAEQKQFEETVETGKANASLVPRLERWCSHLTVNQTTAGLLAEWTKLPIGLLSIDCPHATKGIEAHDLKAVAAYFVSENCRGCSHHHEQNPDNAGREILRESDRVREERAIAAKENGSSSAKLRLRGLVSGDLTAALGSAPTTEQSVLELVALLDEETHAEDAAEKLRQAAGLAPEFFTDLACEVVAEHMADIAIGRICVEVLRIMGMKRGKILPVASQAARHCVELAFCHDEVLAFLGEDIASGGQVPHAAVVAKIIGHQAYGSDVFPSRHERSHLGQIRALIEVGRRDAGRLVSAFEKRLENPNRDVRVGASITLRKLLPEFPALGPVLVDALIASLSLDDERFGRSADVEATRVLASIFALNPVGTQAKLERAFPRASEEVQKLLFRVYRSVTEAARGANGSLEASDMVQCLPAVLDALIPACASASVPLPIRQDAAETIERIARKHASLTLPRVDGILGVLAIVCRQQTDFGASNPGNDPLVPFLPHPHRRAYEMLEHHLSSALKELADEAPSTLWHAVAPVLRKLSTGEAAEAALMARLLPLFPSLSRNHAIAPELIPELFRAVMAMDSVVVRVRALEVVKELLRRSPELVPDNMREMAVIYLRDSYIAIHRAAAKAVSYMPMESETQAIEVAKYLFAQFLTHVQSESGSHHCAELTEELLRATRGHAQLRLTCALPAVLKQCQATEHHTALDAMQSLQELADEEPSLFVPYLRELLKFFERFSKRDHYSSGYSSEHQLFLSFFDHPQGAIADVLTKMGDTIRTIGASDPYEAIQFVSVLLHYERFAEAAEAANHIAERLLEGAKHEGLRTLAKLTAAVARAEASVKAGNSTDGLTILRDAQSLLLQYESISNRNESEAFNDAFSVADLVAERLE